MLTSGLLNLPWWGVLIATLVMTQITIAAVTLYLHRSQAHRAVEFHPAINHFFRFWIWFTNSMNTKEWVAVHRKHHACTEIAGDPHSPQIYGLKKVFFEGVELYRSEIKNEETLERFGRGTPDDWVERNLYIRYNNAGVAALLLLDLLCFGVIGLTVWAVQMLWIPISAAGVVNGIGHYWGYRNFDCKDASRNLIPWALFIGGEELHNNHHAYPNSAKMSVKWWELDIGWLYIRILAFLRLAKINKVSPKLQRIPDKSIVDDETIRAIFSNPLQIMSRYSKDVIVPVLRREKQLAGSKGKQLFHQARRLLTRQRGLVDSSSRQRLSVLLDSCQPLQLVCQYRQNLCDIWSRRSTSQKELLEALQEWCHQAETTGIDVLQKFSGRLKTYVPKPAQGM